MILTYDKHTKRERQKGRQADLLAETVTDIGELQRKRER